MERTIRPVRRAVPLVLATAALAGCEGNAGVEAFGGVPQAAAVASVVVTPSSVTLTAIGQQQQFAATADDSLGVTVAGATFTWSSQDTTVVTVDSTGRARAVGGGTTGVVAQSGGVADEASVTVSLPLGSARPARGHSPPP
jgi:hypothetical protein